ncbi:MULTISPECIES: hypothetical protein [Sphingomonas]|uniref:hypothetical protein n=1 Tax=Sphingomonas TaxID=13687 RepID=UPI000F7DA7E3|nr:hypothetical protein [Sphingomonas sp. ABOLF]RSV14623.1 hypothetical protein CA235_11125 [Sphingomonas sp. ABOLF]GLK19223.1 hypothetical protein GCM10017606_00490 [Microbacterium terregens]
MTALELLGSVGVSAVTAGGIVWAGAQRVAGKWLDSRFTHRLEAVKLEGQRQLEATRQEHTTFLERQKFERATLLDRSAKLNQREFEVIPDIWERATEAHYAILKLISIWQEGADVGRLSEPEFEAFLDKSRLETWQKDEIRALDRFKRTTYYSDAQGWFRHQDANLAVVAFNRAAANGSIFLHPETHARFEEFGEAMRQAFRHWSMNLQFRLDGNPLSKEEDDPVSLYRKDGDERYHTLAGYLRERYWITPEGEAL